MSNVPRTKPPACLVVPYHSLLSGRHALKMRKNTLRTRSISEKTLDRHHRKEPPSQREPKSQKRKQTKQKATPPPNPKLGSTDWRNQTGAALGRGSPTGGKTDYCRLSEITGNSQFGRCPQGGDRPSTGADIILLLVSLRVLYDDCYCCYYWHYYYQRQN